MPHALDDNIVAVVPDPAAYGVKMTRATGEVTTIASTGAGRFCMR
jgi:hypothetical protein